jgi:ATP-dependent DNA helicase RecG
MQSSMRPTCLNPLFAPVTTLPGIAEKTGRLYGRLLGCEQAPRMIDLLLHLPIGAVDRRARPKLGSVTPGTVVTVEVMVERHQSPRRPQGPYLVYTGDDTGTLTIAYFSTRPDLIVRLLPVGQRRVVSGKVAIYDGMLQMAHPDRVDADPAAIPPIEPRYQLTEGLTANAVRRAITAALATLAPLPAWHDLRQASFLSFGDALTAVHQPAKPGDAVPTGAAWSQLAYDEMLAFQLELALERAYLRRPGGPRRARASAGPDTIMQDKLRTALPFRLTASQEAAIAAIAADLRGPERMLRLVQGDVGSGKTMVALFACAAAIENASPPSGAGEDGGRGQAALMVPTELLARQHLASIGPLAAAAGIRIAILTGRERGAERADIRARLARGDIDLLIGTHALFSADVTFVNLVLAVIDEQHRFGVEQRLALAAKGAVVDLLLMTATPMPQTLVLSCFGDVDVCELRDKPAGRKPVVTRALPLDRLDEVVAAVGRALRRDRRVYWICPLIEEAENGTTAAQARADTLAQQFGIAVGLVHGRMKGEARDAAIARFASGEIRLLVATTAIEVGIDVPAASVMVIEGAERFGLAQLHQLRGRIGRGTEEAACLLLYSPPLGETAKARLAILRETADGFRIAEEDLRLRGEGDLFGARQSGTSGFRIARMADHGAQLRQARADAAAALAQDPDLVGERGQALRILLHLFERHAAIRLLAAPPTL